MNKHRKLNKRCLNCGKEIDDRAIYCKSCDRKSEKSRGYRHNLMCIDCGKEITDQATRCKSCAASQKIGKKHPRYKHGLGDLNFNHGQRKCDYIVDYAKWMKDIFERDDYQCQHCGNNEKLRAHHINAFSKYPELRVIIENGITLCEYHHKQLHQLFGNDVTPEQLRWFFNNVE